MAPARRWPTHRWPAADQAAWLLRQLDGNGFALLVFGDGAAAGPRVPKASLLVTALVPAATGTAATRYDARPGTVVLLRPDQHVCARWRAPTAADVAAALRRALALH
jgi:3-(3-hydroxy-phenyl)propionate hydroxylase